MTQAETILTKMQDWLVRKGIGAENKKSALLESTVALPFGAISYLRSERAKSSRIAVVMLHGAAADNTSWVRFARYLKVDLPLIIPDLPGHGKSVSDPAMSYSIGAQADYLAELLQALNVQHVHLIGNSMGGAIAIRLAAIRPELVASLILIGAVGIRDQESWLERHIVETGDNPMIRVQTRADYLAMMRIGMNKPPYMPGFVVSSLARAFMARSRINQKITKDIEADLDQTASVGGISCPVQLIWGREDRVSSVSNGQKLHKLWPSSQLTVMDGVGHVPMVEAPEEVAALCRGFLCTCSKLDQTVALSA
jgi:abhydrolase domain-containing protein 6